MAVFLLLLGAIFLSTGIRGTQGQLASQLASDFSGAGSFWNWIAGIVIIGGLGYFGPLKQTSRLTLGLILLVFVLSNRGIWANLQGAISTPVSAPADAAITVPDAVKVANADTGASTSANSDIQAATTSALQSINATTASAPKAMKFSSAFEEAAYLEGLKRTLPRMGTGDSSGGGSGGGDGTPSTMTSHYSSTGSYAASGTETAIGNAISSALTGAVSGALSGLSASYGGVAGQAISALGGVVSTAVHGGDVNTSAMSALSNIANSAVGSFLGGRF